MNEKYYYSAKMGRFYIDSARSSYEQSADGWPSDAVIVKDKDYAALFAGQSAGKQIVANDKGYPVLADPAPPSPELLVIMAEQKKVALRAAADVEISWRQDAVDAGIASDDESAALIEWRKYRVMLMRVETNKPVWPAPPEINVI